MGVYGYGTAGMKIPEGYLDVEVKEGNNSANRTVAEAATFCKQDQLSAWPGEVRPRGRRDVMLMYWAQMCDAAPYAL